MVYFAGFKGFIIINFRNLKSNTFQNDIFMKTIRKDDLRDFLLVYFLSTQ